MTTAVPPPATTEPPPDRRGSRSDADRRAGGDAFSPVLSLARSRLHPERREPDPPNRNPSVAERSADPLASGRRDTVERRPDRHDSERHDPDRSGNDRHAIDRADNDRRADDRADAQRRAADRADAQRRAADRANSRADERGASDRADGRPDAEPSRPDVERHAADRADSRPDVEPSRAGGGNADAATIDEGASDPAEIEISTEAEDGSLEAAPAGTADDRIAGAEGATSPSTAPTVGHAQVPASFAEGGEADAVGPERSSDTTVTSTDRPASSAPSEPSVAAAAAAENGRPAVATATRDARDDSSEATPETTSSAATTAGPSADNQLGASPSGPGSHADALQIATRRLAEPDAADELASSAGPGRIKTTGTADGVAEPGVGRPPTPVAPAVPTSPVPVLTGADGPDVEAALVQPTAATGQTTTGEIDEVWAQVQRALNRARPIVDGQELRLRLHPAELGELLVQVRTQGEQLTVRLVTSSPAAQQMLLSDQQRLTTELAAAGFDDGTVDIGHRQPSGGDRGPGSDDRSDRASQRPGRPVSAAFVDPDQSPAAATAGGRITTGRRAGLVDVTL